MNLDEIEDRHTRACRINATADDRERSLADIPRLVAAVRQLRGEGPPTHEGGVRELFRAREIGTGRLKVVLTSPDDSQPRIMDAKQFDESFLRLTDPEARVFYVKFEYQQPGEPDWECRRCRQVFPHTDVRKRVVNVRGDELGDWCVICAEICKEKDDG